MNPYDALAALAEQELALVAAGRIDELPQIHADRRALLAALPPKPPADAKPALERAWSLQQRVSEALEERIRQAGEELRRVSRGRTAMHGYAPQTDRLKLVDRAG
jgi:hypothetical protein